MNRARFLILLAIVVALLACLPRTSSAIPVFARKYGFNCTMCHSSYPRLNDFGVRFRNNGYMLPGHGAIEKTILDSPTPLALRTGAGYVFDEFKNVPGAPFQRGFQVVGLDILSAGLLSQKIGYMMIFVPGITEAPGLAGQEASLEMANLVFREIGGSPVSLRAGRFEPAYVAFSVKRHLGDSPYEIYDFSFPGGPAFSETQTGLELRCGTRGPMRAVAGLVQGSGTNRSSDNPQDGYLRLEGVLGAGEGQTAGQRIGLVGYFGRARPDASVAAPNDDAQSFRRYGVDASLNASSVNLGVQYLWGRDNGALWGQGSEATWNGGFAELTVGTDFRAAFLARAEMVNEPSFIDRDLRRYTAGGRYSFEDNVAAHLEYSHQVVNTSAPDDPAEDYFTLRLDMAF